MKELSLLANIIVYCALFIALFYNVTDKLKRRKVEHLLLTVSMFWTLFVTVFLIRNYNAMVESPLNVKLNIYETISNFIFFCYIAYKISVEHCSITGIKKTKLSAKEADFGGGGIKNPPKP